MNARRAEYERTRAAVQQHTVKVVLWAQIFSGLGLAAGVTVGALLIVEATGKTALTGLPVAAITFGSAIAVYMTGQMTSRWGRRPALVVGYLTGVVGACGTVIGAVLESLPLLLGSLLLYGGGTASNLQARYACADLAEPETRGKALSYALVATTVGALIAPNSTAQLGAVATALGLPYLTGPFLLSAFAYLVSAAIMWFFLRPDPYLLAQEHARASRGRANVGGKTIPHQVILGAAITVTAQLVMVGIMAMTPVHMQAHHSLPSIGMAISLHIAAMYLPSLMTGGLVDLVGARAMGAASALTMVAAGVMAATIPAESLVGTIAALVVLGVGWNLGLLSGSTMIVSATSVEERASVQGTVDIAMAAAGAGGGMMAGFVVAHSSHTMLSFLGAGIATIPAVLLALRPLLRRDP